MSFVVIEWIKNDSSEVSFYLIKYINFRIEYKPNFRTYVNIYCILYH